jgi:hypothetical protein
MRWVLEAAAAAAAAAAAVRSVDLELMLNLVML